MRGCFGGEVYSILFRRDLPVFTTELFVHANQTFSTELLRFVHQMDYDSFIVEEVCGLRMDCRNLIHIPRQRRGLYASVPVVTIALAAHRLLRESGGIQPPTQPSRPQSWHRHLKLQAERLDARISLEASLWRQVS